MKRKYYSLILRESLLSYILLVVFESFFYSVSFLLGGMFKSDIINTLTGDSTFFSFDIILLLVLAAVTPILINVVKQLSAYLAALCRVKIDNSIKMNLYKALLKGSNHSGHSPGEVISYFRDDVAEIVTFIMGFYDYLPKLVLSFGALWIMMRINLLFTVISILPLLLILTVMRLFQKKLIKYREESRKATAEVVEVIGEIVDSIETIKLTASETPMMSHYNKLSEKRSQLSVRDTCFGKLLEAITGNLIYLALGVILLCAINAFKDNTFTVGNFVLFEYYFWFLSALPSFVANIMQRYKTSSVSFDRLYKVSQGLILDVEERRGMTKKDFVGCKIMIQEGLAHIPGLKEKISVDIRPHTITVIHGETGSGKSTLIDYIFSHHNKLVQMLDSNGRIVEFNPPQSVMVVQTPALFSDTLVNNVCMSEKKDSDKLEQILYTVSFDKDIRQMEQKYETILGVGGAKISGGQLKRLSLARALYHNPQVMLIDDYESGLDINTQKLIWERLFEKRERTYLLVSNNIEHIEAADCSIDLDRGAVVYKEYI